MAAEPVGVIETFPCRAGEGETRATRPRDGNAAAATAVAQAQRDAVWSKPPRR